MKAKTRRSREDIRDSSRRSAVAKKESVTDYCETKVCADEAPATPAAPTGWKELYLKEDWWAIYLGIGIVVVSL